MSKEEHKDMSMTPILSKYQYQKPKDFGDYTERCYPVSAVMDMLKEYSDQNTKPLIDEIVELKSKVSNCNRMIGHLEEISINKQAEIAKLKAENEKLNKNIKNAMVDISNYLTSFELRNDFNDDIAEFTRKRDWFIDYILNKLK